MVCIGLRSCIINPCHAKPQGLWFCSVMDTFSLAMIPTPCLRIFLPFIGVFLCFCLVFLLSEVMEEMESTLFSSLHGYNHGICPKESSVTGSILFRRKYT